MSKLITIDNEYKDWLTDLKQRIKQSQLKASVRINTEMLELYWSIGADIVERQAESKWGSGVVSQLSKDLKAAFPNADGFSTTNLKYMKQFFSFYNQKSPIGQQAVDQLPEKNTNLSLPHYALIPWGHNILIFTKSKSIDEAMFYLQQTVKNGWSRSELTKQIKDNLYHKLGTSQNNFNMTLPDIQSALATEITKDPYNFDFTSCDLRAKFQESELEDALINHISEFLLEMGNGFAYYGRQVKLNVGTKQLKLDLLFYHVNLHCYVAVELKIGEFDSSDVGQLGTYISAVNHIFKDDIDNPTVGLLICKGKDNTLAQYSLEGSAHPIGISEYDFSNIFPDDYKSALPSLEEIEKELREIN
ncbi:MAG: PDDEXK nuclease domain-containing protein [Clostridiales Family XIII bacterium]|nr:PDDEXK nuclease domain-containing protein [Clostridiales Family XIII bacterium]